MNIDQIISFALLAAVFGLLIWGRVRYDVAAFGALVLAVLAAPWSPRTLRCAKRWAVSDDI